MRLLRIIVLCVLGSGVVLAQGNQTEILTANFNEIITSDCGESVIALGMITGTVHTLNQPNVTSYHSSWGPRGDVRAIGLDTGNVYPMVGHTMSRWIAGDNGLTHWGYADTFKIVGLYSVHYNYLIDITYDSESWPVFTSRADNFKAGCDK